MVHVKDKNLAINFAWLHLKISHLLVNASFLNDPISLKGYGIRDHHGNKRLKRYNNNHECHGLSYSSGGQPYLIDYLTPLVHAAHPVVLIGQHT